MPSWEAVKLKNVALGEGVSSPVAHSDMARRMSELGEEVTAFRDFWQAPPTDAVYFHRKLGGMFLLASRLKARVNVHQLIKQFF